MLINAIMKGKKKKVGGIIGWRYTSVDSDRLAAESHKGQLSSGGRPVSLDSFKLSHFSERDVHCALSLRSNEL